MRAIDSSSLAKYVNKEQDWEEIAKQLASDRCSTLEFAMQEVGNSIWKRVLRKEVPKENALSVFQEFVRAVLDDGRLKEMQCNNPRYIHKMRRD